MTLGAWRNIDRNAAANVSPTASISRRACASARRRRCHVTHRTLVDPLFGDTLVGPTILQWGTEEQKQRYLAAIAAGEMIATMALPDGAGPFDADSATVAANALFASITGSSIASASVFTRIAVPEMLRFGYTTRLSI